MVQFNFLTFFLLRDGKPVPKNSANQSKNLIFVLIHKKAPACQVVETGLDM